MGSLSSDCKNRRAWEVPGSDHIRLESGHVLLQAAWPAQCTLKCPRFELWAA